MPKPRVSAAGGFAAVAYTFRKGREAGGVFKLYKRMRSRNACKTCAYGMGGQRGGMVNEAGSFPEVCKKSLQAQAGDMQAPISEAFFREHSIKELESWSSLQMEAAGRLAFPIALTEGDSHFRRIGWDEALDRVARDLEAAPRERTFFYGSGRSSNEAAFLMQVLARAYGTTNIHNCSYYCHQASGVALSRVFGTGTSTLVLDDLDKADLAIVAGANPASNHPRLIVKLVEMKERGGTVIVINPVKELGLVRFKIPSRPGSLLFGSDVSDIYLQPHVGADIACFKALLKGVIERDGVDRAYVRDHVEGWEAVESDVVATPWELLVAESGLKRDDVDRAAAALVAARRGVMLWAMGLTHHEHGVQNVVALANLALARGWVGREGCGLLPIRGHSNVQGVGSVGFAPALKEAFAKKMEEIYGIPPASTPGLDTFRCMEAAHAGKIRVAVFLGGNLFGSNPDRRWAAQSLQRIDTTCAITTKLNEGHVHGRGRHHVVLPVLARDEEKQSTTQESMFNFVRVSDGGETAPRGEIRSEVDVICALAARLLPPGPFPFEAMTSHDAVRRAIAAVVPGYAPIASVGATKAEFQIPGRTFHEPNFATASGRARTQVTPLPAFRTSPGQFRLMTLRSEGQFNTVVYEDEDLYRGVTRRDVVMMAEADAAALNLREDDPVDVVTELGRMRVVAAFIDIPAGNLAMYYPEANAVVPRRVDPESGTPAFKSILARLEPVRGVTRRFDLVAFDVDGTLVHHPEDKTVWEVLNLRFTGSDDQNVERWDLYKKGKISYAEWVALDIESWRDAGATRETITGCFGSLTLVDGARETLDTLKARGVRLAVISGTLDVMLDAFFPDHPFDEVYTNHLAFDAEGRIAHWRATPFDMDGKGIALRSIALREGIPLARCAFIGDHANDVAAARLAGFSVAFNPKSAELEAVASAIVRSRDLRDILPHLT